MNKKIQTSTFVYQALSDASTQIRLCTIQPDTEDATLRLTLHETPLAYSHACLSYTWGPDKDHQTILINDRSFRVRPILFSFLHSARCYNFTGPVWIDAICINQADVQEKNQQVQMMGKIYSQATKTIVWLGLGSEECEALRAVESFVQSPINDFEVRQWKKVHNDEKPLQNDAGTFKGRSNLLASCLRNRMLFSQFTDTPLYANWQYHTNKNNLILHFATADYWRRAWIVQEIILSQDAIILCPNSNLVRIANILALVVIVIRYLREQEHRTQTNSSSLRKPSSNPDFRRIEADIQFVAHHLLAKHGHGSSEDVMVSKSISIEQALSLTWSRLCQNIRDRVFSILSIITSTSDFKVDYTQTPEEILFSLVQSEARSTTSVTQDKLAWHLSMVAWSAAKALQIQPPSPNKLESLDVVLAKRDKRNGGSDRLFWANQQSSPSNDTHVPVCSTCFLLELVGTWKILECRFDAASMAVYPPQWWIKMSGQWIAETQYK